MREIECDVAVIGAGTAGIAAHRAALQAGVRSVLIERGPGGTTCARVGCMPSKVLIAAATAAHDARAAGAFGVRVEGVQVDGRAVMERVRSLRDRFVGSVLDGLDDLPPESRIPGNAVFEDPDRLRIDDAVRLRFAAAVVATGSSPSVPKPLADLGERVLTTDTLFEIAALPETLAVLGGGAVGLELSQALARLGVTVSLFDPSAALGGLSDPDLKEAAAALFARDVALHLGAEVKEGTPSGEGARLRWSGGEDGGGTDTFARVLAAAGRPPNLEGLCLDRAGLSLDDKGMPAFDARSLLCAGAPVFIAGDVNQARPVLHEAARQGRIAGRNAAALVASGRSAVERPARWPSLALVFTHPQIAVIGSAYDDGSGDRLVGRADLRDQGRARIMDRNEGGLRVYADRAGRLLGAEMIGPGVEHLAQLLAFAIQDGRTAQDLRERPFYHPTLEEGLETALADVARQAKS